MRFWLVSGNGLGRPEEPLMVGFGDGSRALAVFSFEEDSRLFLRFGGRGWRVRAASGSSSRCCPVLAEGWGWSSWIRYPKVQPRRFTVSFASNANDAWVSLCERGRGGRERR
jgi:hypothetical protein